MSRRGGKGKEGEGARMGREGGGWCGEVEVWLIFRMGKRRRKDELFTHGTAGMDRGEESVSAKRLR